MSTLLIRHSTTNYDIWRRAFDDDADIRRANGVLSDQVYRSGEDDAELWLILQWDNPARARLFVQSDDFLDFLERAAITDRPSIWYLVEAERPSG